MLVELIMKFVVVPFKNFKLAKSRMRKDISDQKTEEIVEKMLIHVLSEVSKSKLSNGNFIVTKDKKAMELAKKVGIKIIKEERQVSESISVDYASKLLMKKGAECILRIPGDLPLLSKEDIDTIFKKYNDLNCSIIVPSKSGNGTNAILRKPPDVIKSYFGEDSFKKHVDEFKKNKAQYEIIENKNIGLDIDCLSDLKDFEKNKNYS